MATINFNQQLFAQEALQALTRNLAPLSGFSRDYSSMTAAKGSAIVIPLVSSVTATTFNQSYTGTGGVINSVTVNLNKHRIATVSFTDVQALNASPVSGMNFAQQLGKALADIVLSDIIGSITTTDYGAALITTAAANWSKTQIRAMRKQLNINGASRSPRTLYVTNEIEDYLLSDSNVLQAYQIGNMGGSAPIQSGSLPPLLGFNVVATDVVGFAGGITQAAIACAQDALAVAMRAVDPLEPGAYFGVEKVTDNETGISATQRVNYDPNTGTVHINLECLFGYAPAVTKNLVFATIP